MGFEQRVCHSSSFRALALSQGIYLTCSWQNGVHTLCPIKPTYSPDISEFNKVSYIC